MVLDMVLSAEPADIEGLVVVVVVSVGVGFAALFAGVRVGVVSSGCCPGEDALSVGVVGAVLLGPFGFDSIGLPFVERESVGFAVSGCAEVAASSRAETTDRFGRGELAAAVFAMLDGWPVRHSSSFRAT
jgi:hypothetical protein